MLKLLGFSDLLLFHEVFGLADVQLQLVMFEDSLKE